MTRMAESSLKAFFFPRLCRTWKPDPEFALVTSESVLIGQHSLGDTEGLMSWRSLNVADAFSGRTAAVTEKRTPEIWFRVWPWCPEAGIRKNQQPSVGLSWHSDFFLWAKRKHRGFFFALFCCCCLFVSFFVCCFILFCFKKEGKVSVFDERQAWAIFEVWGNGTVVWGYKMQKVLRTNRPGEKSLASQK